MIDVFTEALQHPVVIPDGRGLIFTRSKVALQLSEHTGLLLVFWLHMKIYCRQINLETGGKSLQEAAGQIMLLPMLTKNYG